MVTLNGESLTPEQVAAVARGGEEVEIDAQAVKRMRSSREEVERMAEGETPMPIRRSWPLMRT